MSFFKMSEETKINYKTILVSYQAIVEIVLGVCSFCYAIDRYLKAQSEDAFSSLYYWFIAGSLLEIVKGGILLDGIRNSKPLSILIYFLSHWFVLFIAKAFLVSLAIERYKEFTNLKPEFTSRMEIRPTKQSLIFDFVIFYPIIMFFHWFNLFFVYKYYKSLTTIGTQQSSLVKDCKFDPISDKDF